MILQAEGMQSECFAKSERFFRYRQGRSKKCETQSLPTPIKSIDFVGAFFNAICLRQGKLLCYEIHFVCEILLRNMKRQILFHINGVDISLREKPDSVRQK